MTKFGANYQADRASFIADGLAIGATLASHAIKAPGPNGETLTIDTARVGPPLATRLLVVVSGTHGVEGPAGSAVQRYLLSELLPHLPMRDGDAALCSLCLCGSSCAF